MIEDYAYEGEDFHHDPEIPFPKGEEWDDRGKKDVTILVFIFLFLYSIFML